MLICSACKNRALCTQICPEAELIVDEDYVPQREETIGLPRETNPLPELKANNYLTNTEREIVTLLGKGLNRADVAQLLNITRITLRKHLSRIRKKYAE